MQDMQDKQDIKLCKNCKYYSKEYITHVCKHELSVLTPKSVNHVTGYTTSAIYRDCYKMRYMSNCGEEGDLFEEREDLVYKIIKFFKKVKP